MRTSSKRTVFTMSIVGLLFGGALGWAGATLMAPPPDVLAPVTFTYATAVEGEIGQSLQLNVAATWKTSPVGANSAAGTVTSVTLSDGQSAVQNSELYAVDLRPVHVAAGDTPAFRDLHIGDKGADVQQLQQMLRDSGFSVTKADGTYTAGTELAVKKWQKASGVDADGSVRAGDLIFVPNLPSRLTLDPAIVHRGARLGGGEAVLSALPSSPSFAITATTAQSAAIPEQARVTISAPEGQGPWNAVVASREADSDGQVVLALTGASDQPICADSCGVLRTDAPSYLASEIVIVPQQQGVTVPSAAIRTDSNGAAVVLNEANDAVPVTVLGGTKGISLVKGISPGYRVRLPAEAQ